MMDGVSVISNLSCSRFIGKKRHTKITMKVLVVFAALICVSLAIVLPKPSNQCNCDCPINPLANRSDKEDIVCHCPACPTCNCQPCRAIEPIAEGSTKDATVSQLLPLPPPILCKCARCPPLSNPPECDCKGSCPLIRCYCPECAAV